MKNNVKASGSRLIRRLLLLAMVAVLAGTPFTGFAAQQTAPASDALGVAVGAYLNPIDPGYTDKINTFNQTVGKSAAIISFYDTWRDGSRTAGSVFDPYLLNKMQQDTRLQPFPVIMINWMPLAASSMEGCTKTYSSGQFIPYPDLIGGVCDTYIRRFATDLSGRPERFLIRFAHEMNISDQVWWPGHFGLGPDAYIKAYRHIHDVFVQAQKAAGKQNVEWVWGPNYFSHPAEDWNLLHNYYPGDAYVDWIGLSGYNWYPNYTPYRSFPNIYGNVDGSEAYYRDFLPGVLHDLACHYAKPQILAEYGTAGTSNVPEKPNWISDTLSRIPNYPFLRAAVWYNLYLNGSNVDFRITNVDGDQGAPTLSTQITSAYKNAIASPVFRSTLPSLSQATPPTTYCGSGEAQFTLTPDFVMTKPGGSSYHTLTGMLYSGHPTIKVSAPSGISYQVVSDNLTAPWGTARIRLAVGSSVKNGIYTVTITADGHSFPVTIAVMNRIYQQSLPIIVR